MELIYYGGETKFPKEGIFYENGHPYSPLGKGYRLATEVEIRMYKKFGKIVPQSIDFILGG